MTNLIQALTHPTHQPAAQTVAPPVRGTIQSAAHAMMNRAAEMRLPFDIVNITVIGETKNPSGYEWRVIPKGMTRIDSIETIVDDLSMVAGCPVRLVRRDEGVYLRYVRPGAVSADYPTLLEAVREQAKNHLGVPFFGVGFLPNGRPLMARLDMPNACHVGIFSQTQSGKTNLAQVALSTLCATCSPRHVQVVIIDHKNNADFAHMIGKNVSVHATNRTQWLDALRNVRRLMDHRKLHLNEFDSWSHVVVYCDELGEVAHEGGKEITDQFDSIARRGAGLKVHMFVATQRPTEKEIASVVQSQIAFRIIGKVNSAREAVIVAGVGGTGAHTINRIGHFIAVKADKGGGHLDFFVPKMDVPVVTPVGQLDLTSFDKFPAKVSATLPTGSPDLSHRYDKPVLESADKVLLSGTASSATGEDSGGVAGFSETDDASVAGDATESESDIKLAEMVARLMFIMTGASDAAKIKDNELFRRCKFTDDEGNPLTKIGGGSLHPRWKRAKQIVADAIDNLSKSQ